MARSRGLGDVYKRQIIYLSIVLNILLTLKLLSKK
jgi:hypothetical protein